MCEMSEFYSAKSQSYALSWKASRLLRLMVSHSSWTAIPGFLNQWFKSGKKSHTWEGDQRDARIVLAIHFSQSNWEWLWALPYKLYDSRPLWSNKPVNATKLNTHYIHGKPASRTQHAALTFPVMELPPVSAGTHPSQLSTMTCCETQTAAAGALNGFTKHLKSRDPSMQIVRIPRAFAGWQLTAQSLFRTSIPILKKKIIV